MKGLHYVGFNNGLIVDRQCSFQVLTGVDYIDAQDPFGENSKVTVLEIIKVHFCLSY